MRISDWSSDVCSSDLADIWVNAAYPRTADWATSRQDVFDAKSWRTNVDLQMNSYCLLSAAVAAAMAQRGSGSIVNVASIYGVVGPDFTIYEGLEMTTPPAYSAIKGRSEEHTSELQSLMRTSYAVFCLKKQKNKDN